MARRRYLVWNAATAALTAAPTMVTTGTALKPMLQVKPSTYIAVIAWGYSFDVTPTAVVKVELITTGTVNATVTAFNAGDVVKFDDSGNAASSQGPPRSRAPPRVGPPAQPPSGSRGAWRSAPKTGR